MQKGLIRFNKIWLQSVFFNCLRLYLNKPYSPNEGTRPQIGQCFSVDPVLFLKFKHFFKHKPC